MAETDTQLKQKLVKSALQLFAQRGYDGVSLRDIAAHADVSHGSVRYHFGSKESLYEASLTRLASCDVMSSELSAEVDADAMTRDQAVACFRKMVTGFVAYQARVGSNKAMAMGMLQSEISRGDGPDPAFYAKVIGPGHDRLKRIIRHIRPDIDDDETLEILTFNVLFQCVMIRTGQGIIIRRLGVNALSKSAVERISDLIISTTLDGLNGLEC